jgi:hypothetical protein
LARVGPQPSLELTEHDQKEEKRAQRKGPQNEGVSSVHQEKLFAEDLSAQISGGFKGN